MADVDDLTRFKSPVYLRIYMESETKVARYGNSLSVRLLGITRELDLREGDRVALRTVDAGLLIECPKRGRLAARLDTVRERNPRSVPVLPSVPRSPSEGS